MNKNEEDDVNGEGISIRR